MGRSPYLPKSLAALLARAALLLVAAGAFGAAGCGLLSSDSVPLPGVYESDDFRVQRLESAGGGNDDVAAAGAVLQMTLTEDGRVTGGRLFVPAAGEGRAEAEYFFEGTYDRDGQRVTFDFADGALSEDYFETGVPLAEVEWIFYDEEEDAMLSADAVPYVLFMERIGGAPGEEAGAE